MAMMATVRIGAIHSVVFGGKFLNNLPLYVSLKNQCDHLNGNQVRQLNINTFDDKSTTKKINHFSKTSKKSNRTKPKESFLLFYFFFFILNKINVEYR